MQTNGNFSDMYKKLLIFPTVQGQGNYGKWKMMSLLRG